VVEPIGETGEVLVTAIAPPNTFACRVFASALDSVAGLSTPIDPLYYRPDIGFVGPNIASTDGGTRVLAVGVGLLPLHFPSPDEPGEPDYDSIELFVEKGGRRAQVAPGLIQRRPPSLSRLSFELPPSPDGRPGPADLILAVDLQTERIEARAPALFAFGDVQPDFGPRGTALPTAPTHVAFGDLEGDGGALDGVACWGTQPTVQLLVGQGNGMLHRAGAPWIGGSATELLERSPRRLFLGDHDRNGTVDVIVLNQGDGVAATHTLLLGQRPPAAPLRVAGRLMHAASTVAAAAEGDLDGNGLVDLVVLPPFGSPEVCLSFGDALGGPRFQIVPLPQADDTRPFEVVEIADLDGDGRLDLAFARGQADVVVRTLYGRGDGTFDAGQTIPLTRQIHNYLADPLSVAVGLHAIGDARLRGLALVLKGTASASTPATVAVLDYLGGRQHGLPAAERTINHQGEAFIRSLAADLDGDGAVELVLGCQEATTQASVRVFQWGTVGTMPAFVELPGAADPGAEPMIMMLGLAYGTAGMRGGTPAPAVFVAHKYLFPEEDRITTLLVDRTSGTPRLLAPDSSHALPYPVEGVTLGRFRGEATPANAADVVAATSGSTSQPAGLQLFTNDGFGTLTPAARYTLPLLPGTVATLPIATGDAAIALGRDSVLHVVRPTVPPPHDVLSLPLHPYLPEILRAAEVTADARLAVADVDGDGASDVVALLTFRIGAGTVEEEEGGQLLVVFGKPGATATDLPLFVPDPAEVRSTPAHGFARDLVIEEFAVNAAPMRRLEVAVAVGGDANHVRFYRLDRADEPHPVRSLRRSFASAAEPALLAGEGPERLATADVDGDGVVDLAVVSAGDRRLRLFTNTALAGEEVDIAAFRQIQAGVLTLPEGVPAQIFLSDLNGDASPDLLVNCCNETPVLTNAVQYHLGTGTGQFGAGVRLPPIRTGDMRWAPSLGGLVQRRARVRLAVGELNGDGAPDIVSGCPTAGAEDRNLLVLFGGAR